MAYSPMGRDVKIAMPRGVRELCEDLQFVGNRGLVMVAEDSGGVILPVPCVSIEQGHSGGVRAGGANGGLEAVGESGDEGRGFWAAILGKVVC